MQIFVRFITTARTLRDNFISNIGGVKPYAPSFCTAAGRLRSGLGGQIDGRPRRGQNPDIAVFGREILGGHALNFLRRNAPDRGNVCADR